MTFTVALAIIAAVQGIFLLLLVVFLVLRRVYDRREQVAFVAARAGIAAPLRAWLIGGGAAEPVVAAIRKLPRRTAIGYTSILARHSIPTTQIEELAFALRGESWVGVAVRQRASRFWWRRLEAARALSLVGSEHERAAVAALVRDEHPAVQVAAIAALPRVADAALYGQVLDRMHAFPKIVRQYLVQVLRQSRTLVGPQLALRIRDGTDPVELASWIELAEAVDDHEALAMAIARATHPAEGVRRATARALGHLPSPDALLALTLLVKDTVPSVRAAAARTLGELGVEASVASVAPLLTDPVWLVRLRAAVALTQLGERGRRALRDAREGPDRFARDMAGMVSGLSDGALLELSEA